MLKLFLVGFILFLNSVEASTKLLWSEAHPVQPVVVPDGVKLVDDYPRNKRLIIRAKSGVWYLLIDGTGLMYMLQDSSWKRIDQSNYAGDSFSSHPFLYKDRIYRFGGYGFWRSSGALRIYLPESGEWECIIANQGPHLVFNQRVAFSESSQKLYVFGSEMIDQAYQSKITYNDSMYFYDFSQSKWNVLGELNSLIPSNLEYKSILIPDGVLLISDTVFRIDLKNLKFSIEDSRIQILIKRFIGNYKQDFIIVQNEGLFTYDKSSFILLDSLKMEFVIQKWLY